jgi:hypothetical protein
VDQFFAEELKLEEQKCYYEKYGQRKKKRIKIASL